MTIKLDWCDRHTRRTVDWWGINLCYSDTNNGGGLFFASDFVNTAKKLWGNRAFNHVFEWCSGPGFLGYALLANNMCNRLTLSDINDSALDEAKHTADTNNLSDRVDVYHSDVWDSVPSEHCYDLIIGNPPWYCSTNYWNERWSFEERIYLDVDWNAHRKFYSEAGNRLTDDGSILLLEGSYGSGLNTWSSMIADAGLKVEDHFLGDWHTPAVGKFSYYIHLTKL